jgi:hypothetical protein
MEDLGKWKTWVNGGPGELEDMRKCLQALRNGGTGEMEDQGNSRT